MRSELDEKREVMLSLQETASRLCLENHPAKLTVEVKSGVLICRIKFCDFLGFKFFFLCFPKAYSAALQTQWQWVDQLCVCVEQHLRDNAAYFQVPDLDHDFFLRFYFLTFSVSHLLPLCSSS